MLAGEPKLAERGRNGTALRTQGSHSQPVALGVARSLEESLAARAACAPLQYAHVPSPKPHALRSWTRRGPAPSLAPRRGGLLDVLSAISVLGSEGIVRAAQQAEIVRVGAAALASGMAMIELEPSSGSAAHAGCIDP